MSEVIGRWITRRNARQPPPFAITGLMHVFPIFPFQHIDERPHGEQVQQYENADLLAAGRRRLAHVDEKIDQVAYGLVELQRGEAARYRHFVLDRAGRAAMSLLTLCAFGS